jgi:CHAT domain-containing protein
LALSPRRGSDTGFVPLSEIMSYPFKSDLVVLSGCDTSRGEHLGSEGLNSLARGFLAQGAGATLSTLWPVSDAASVQFMDLYYEQLALTGDAIVSLARAQRRMHRHRTFRRPSYWAGYIVHTSGRSLSLSPRPDQ